MKTQRRVALAVVLPVLALALLAPVPAAHAQLAVSVNDNKVVLVNGVVKTVPNGPPDTVKNITATSGPRRRAVERRVTGACGRAPRPRPRSPSDRRSRRP